jgi:hypothetical protein
VRLIVRGDDANAVCGIQFVRASRGAVHRQEFFRCAQHVRNDREPPRIRLSIGLHRVNPYRCIEPVAVTDLIRDDQLHTRPLMLLEKSWQCRSDQRMSNARRHGDSKLMIGAQVQRADIRTVVIARIVAVAGALATCPWG